MPNLGGGDFAQLDIALEWERHREDAVSVPIFVGDNLRNSTSLPTEVSFEAKCLSRALSTMTLCNSASLKRERSALKHSVNVFDLAIAFLVLSQGASERRCNDREVRLLWMPDDYVRWGRASCSQPAIRQLPLVCRAVLYSISCAEMYDAIQSLIQPPVEARERAVRARRVSNLRGYSNSGLRCSRALPSADRLQLYHTGCEELLFSFLPRNSSLYIIIAIAEI